MTDVSAQKKALRASLLAKRAAILPTQRAQMDAAICDRIAALAAFREADLILAFFPVRGEVDLRPLYRLAAELHIPLAFPRCEGKEMTFHIVAHLDELVPDRFRIPAPPVGAPLAVCTEKTLCLLPGLAAARDGARLGYGGGFYDRFLATFGGITLFPVYEGMLLSTLPTEPTDLPVAHIMTEKGEIPRNG
jgi:5-formyltetrahydrofolate cyclo-ligase